MLDAQYTPNGIRIYNAGITGSSDAVPPMPISSYSILSIPAYWRAMRFLSENLASFPRSVRQAGAKPKPGGDPHPLTRLLQRRPNACQNATIFWRTLFFHAAHSGNGYAEIVRPDLYRPAALRNLMPEDIWPFRYDREDGRGALQYYLDRSRRPARILVAADVVHLQSLGYDGMMGTDVVSLHSETFQRAATLNRYQTKYLQKGTVIRGAIEIPTGVTKEQTTEIVNVIKDFFTGPNAERDVIVLSDGAKLNNQTLSASESQLVEQGANVTKQIAQITGVPPQFLYEFSESKYNNSIEQMGQDVVRNTFRPWIEQTEDELTLKLLTEDEQDDAFRIHINPDALLRGDTAAVNASAVTTVNAGLRTRNEGRELIGLAPDPDPESNKLKTLGDTSPGGGTGGTAPFAAEDAGAENGDAAPPEKASRSNGSHRTAQSIQGYHASAALEVLKQVKAGEVSDVVAVELLAAMGIDREAAQKMADASKPAATSDQV